MHLPTSSRCTVGSLIPPEQVVTWSLLLTAAILIQSSSPRELLDGPDQTARVTLDMTGSVWAPDQATLVPPSPDMHLPQWMQLNHIVSKTLRPGPTGFRPSQCRPRSAGGYDNLAALDTS